MTKYPEYIEAGAAVKDLITLARGGSLPAKQIAKDAWVIGGYGIALTLGEPDAAVPPGTLKLARAEDTPTFDEACDVLTAHFDPEIVTGKPMPFIVSALLVLLQNALTKVPPPWGAAISAAFTAILEAATE